eukprot:TRINITY_DN16_c0_g3_i1.p1 TRINITY_DN16_c0_g3~~TRINITY_DN16_c0_g3_i1.p1  ORF type:complete len:504 (-),score=108.75 TRINITY_DN16_c0_g3_i1:927-2438(-)
MTGRYPSHTGVGPAVISMQKGYGLPPKEVIIPKRLKEVGYATHMVGKWHLGYCDPHYFPTSRGFDTWFGYSSGAQDYWTHVSGSGNSAGYDFNTGKAGSDVELILPKSKYNGTYGLYAHIAEAVSVIKDHGKNHANTPLFMYVALQAVHSPLEVPEKYLAQYSAITNSNHRIYAGMVTAMDEGVGNVTKALKDAGLWDDTVLIFASDNGGPWAATANNYPLRGQKATNWEGGMRAVAFVTGPGAGLSSSAEGTSRHNLMHITDWHPTIMEIAGVKSTPPNALDGVSQWSAITTGATSPRTRIVHNMSPKSGTLHGALRDGDWKLILKSTVSGSAAQENTTQGLQVGWTINTPAVGPCPASVNGAWLFNVANDPYETTNLVSSNPSKYQELWNLFQQLQEDAVPDLGSIYPIDQQSMPSNNQWNAYIPWSDKPNSSCSAWSEYISASWEEGGGDGSGAATVATGAAVVLAALGAHLLNKRGQEIIFEWILFVRRQQRRVGYHER